MDSYLLQDWSVLSGGNNTLTQSEAGWLDLSMYRDVVAWLQVSQVSVATLTIGYQTAAAKDDSLFTNMAQFAGIATGVTVTPMLQDVATLATANAFPLARWFRWQLIGTAAWTINFRIWISANKPGRASANRAGAAR